MVNGISPQLNSYNLPQIQQTQVQQPQVTVQDQPVNNLPGGNSAVTIQIFNPTVGTTAPYNYPQTSVYNPQYTQPSQVNYSQPQPQIPIYNNNQNIVNSPPQNIEHAPNTEKTDAKKEETTKKVVLTDNYIKNLENYLNNENSKIRLMGAKELLERFKEDKSRMQDPALTALMNKALQDPMSSIRYLALSIIDAGYATGNNETVQILKNMQANNDKNYAEDALAASEVLLKMSGNTVEAPKSGGIK